MMKLYQILVLVAVGIIVGVADALIKKSSESGSFMATLRNPLMLAVWALYITQTLLAIFIFLWGGKLGLLVNLFIVFYSITGIILGYLIFNESISLVQGIGIILALTGAILINIPAEA